MRVEMYLMNKLLFFRRENQDFEFSVGGGHPTYAETFCRPVATTRCWHGAGDMYFLFVGSILPVWMHRL